MIFNHFLGIRAETLRAPVAALTSESVPAGNAFHRFLVAFCDLILGIVAQEEAREMYNFVNMPHPPSFSSQNNCKFFSLSAI